MRDLIVTLIVIGAIPVTLIRPYVGVLMLAWLGYMNPHRLSWGFATDMPFVMILVVATVIGLLFSKEKIRIPFTIEVVLLVMFILFMGLTTLMALEPMLAGLQYEKVMKIQIITFLTMMLITSKERINLLIWVIVLSFGFYGFKGGLFTALTGGNYHVWGPSGTFIGGNNELGLALVMTVPLMRYLQLQTANKKLKLALTGLMLLTIIAILGTQSRGALLGLAAMAAILSFKSKKRFTLLIVLGVSLPIFLAFMPQSWWDRMHTIKTYEQDASAMGRINAWKFAMNLAADRPLVGGGYEVFTPLWFAQYAPNPADVHDAHSIYFEVLGEHGYVGLILFLGLLVATWLSGARIIRACKGNADLEWAEILARMLQVALVGYMVSGAFLGLAYFDYLYHIIAIMVVLKALVLMKGDQTTGMAGKKEVRLSSHFGAGVKR